MTYTEFINHEIAIWGEDYVFDLLDKGYSVVNTTHGYKWVLPASATNTSQVLRPTENYATLVTRDRLAAAR